jgi:hypothetical protein
MNHPKQSRTKVVSKINFVFFVDFSFCLSIGSARHVLVDLSFWYCLSIFIKDALSALSYPIAVVLYSFIEIPSYQYTDIEPQPLPLELKCGLLKLEDFEAASRKVFNIEGPHLYTTISNLKFTFAGSGR